MPVIHSLGYNLLRPCYVQDLGDALGRQTLNRFEPNIHQITESMGLISLPPSSPMAEH